MESWFVKSILATVAIVPAFLAIPFFKFKFGIDPLVYLIWYSGGDRQELEARLVKIKTEIRQYPPPIAGCDVQFQRLLEERAEIARKLREVA